jgi:hypothetical protein
MVDITKMFDAYKKHLDIIRELGITDRTDDYICTICLRGFSKEEITELSLEDVPQVKLGGRKIAITCRHCNNTCGNTIDFHLINYINLMERKCFLPGSSRKIKILNLGDGKPIEASLRIRSKDNIELVIPNDYYNSKTYKERLDTIAKDAITMVQDKPIKLNTNYVSAAIIKNAYILLFSLTGFTIILDNYYDRIRDIIKNPDLFSLPNGMWRKIKNMPLEDGVYVSYSKHCPGFFIIYTIKKILAYRYLVYLPSPSNDFEKSIDAFQKLKHGDVLQLERIKSNSCALEKENIELFRKWAYS